MSGCGYPLPQSPNPSNRIGYIELHIQKSVGHLPTDNAYAANVAVAASAASYARLSRAICSL